MLTKGLAMADSAGDRIEHSIALPLGFHGDHHTGRLLRVLHGGASSLFGIFAAVYYWYPKITGRMMNETLGWIHFIGSFICMNGIFMPMFILGLAGVNRRLYDGGLQYAHAKGVAAWNTPMTEFALVLGLFQLVFIVNLFGSLTFGRKASTNPWNSPTLEWTAAPTPPIPNGNFETMPSVYRSAYEYSVVDRGAHAADPER